MHTFSERHSEYQFVYLKHVSSETFGCWRWEVVEVKTGQLLI